LRVTLGRDGRRDLPSARAPVHRSGLDPAGRARPGRAPDRRRAGRPARDVRRQPGL